jgi:hypothetical protein
VSQEVRFQACVLVPLLILSAGKSTNSLRDCEIISTLAGHWLYRRSRVNMAAPFSVCTKEEQRAVIGFLWAEGVPVPEINRRLSAEYKNSAIPKGNVYKWITVFKNGPAHKCH